MVKFLKYMLATFTGGLFLFIFLFLIVLAIIGISASSDDSVAIKENTLLVLKLNGPIVERVAYDSFQEIMDQLSANEPTEGLNKILANIKKASRDSKIKGILLESGMLSTGYATIEEIRDALIDFKTSGKFIYSYADVYTQKAYYLASVADKVYLNPSGMLELKGIYSQRMFFKNTLEKIGVEMQIFKHGKYKSAVEPFINEKMSDASREQTEKYVNSIWAHVKSKIADSRNIDEKKLDELADQMALFLQPTVLVDNGIIDGLKYKDELIDELKNKLKVDTKKDINSVSNRRYSHAFVDDTIKGFAKDKIAIIYAEGEIDGANNEGIQSDDLSKTIRKARRDSSIKAIVLRINSPGGSALGSEIIWREVALAKETKPIVVSMGDLAASGGYYIACAADTIIAQPTTLTGSIGIFGMIPNAENMFKKIGVSFDGVKTNRYADMPSINRPFKSDEKELLQAYIERGYQTFIKRCADGRKTTTEAIDKIGQGRVWAGDDAIDFNLVDKTGNIDDAVAVAKSMTDLEKYRIVELPEIEDPFTQIMKKLGGNAKAWVASQIWSEELEAIETIKNLKKSYPIQARLPYNLSIK